MIVPSLICLAMGIAALAASLSIPNRRVDLEGVGAGLFVLGLCLVGAGMPLFR